MNYFIPNTDYVLKMLKTSGETCLTVIHENSLYNYRRIDM